MKLGGVWWASENDYILDTFDRQPEDAVCHVGWSQSGGVWVLRTSKADMFHQGSGIIYNSATMEEQCSMIEKYGGTYYAQPTDSPCLNLDLDLTATDQTEF